MDSGLLWASMVSFLGILAMGLVAVLVQPPLVAFSQLPQKLGATVSVEADVAHVDSRPDGWTRLRLQQDNASADAVSEARLNLSAGDRIRITGQVGTYSGRIQIQIESPDDVRLLRAWREHHIPLATILQEPWRFEGTHVRTSGTITERRLTTDHDAFGIPLRGRFEAQGPTIVEGLVEFDASLAQFHLQVERAQPMAGSP